tara:strand:- start:3788 stop:4393 length:606 start_codon:yes stop_codon:yes gene_type:complete
MTKMAFNIKKSCFVKSATKPSHFPDDIYPEYFFAGKSNAGKSSLLNKICNRKNLAITSKTPGRTQLINFFLINNSISFVDIPGYGYANTPKKIIASWEDMINAYLSTRKKIICMFIAIDIRRGIEELDKSMINLCLSHNINVNIVMTKSDKVSKSEKTQKRNKTKEHVMGFPNILSVNTFSAKSGDGVDLILSIIENSNEN